MPSISSRRDQTGGGPAFAPFGNIEHPQTHEWLVLQPGEEPAEAVAEAITNPDCWESDDGEREPPAGEPNPETEPVPEPTPVLVGGSYRSVQGAAAKAG